MKKGFTLIEIVLCMTFVSIIVLSFIVILLNIRSTLDKINENSLNYEKIKYINEVIDNAIYLNNIETIEIIDNQLFINDHPVIKFSNNTLMVYHNDIIVCEEEVSKFHILNANSKLIKIEITLKNRQIERYYYIGSN